MARPLPSPRAPLSSVQVSSLLTWTSVMASGWSLSVQGPQLQRHSLSSRQSFLRPTSAVPLWPRSAHDTAALAPGHSSGVTCHHRFLRPRYQDFWTMPDVPLAPSTAWPGPGVPAAGVAGGHRAPDVGVRVCCGAAKGRKPGHGTALGDLFVSTKSSWFLQKWGLPQASQDVADQVAEWSGL